MNLFHDHTIYNHTIFPASGYIEMVIAIIELLCLNGLTAHASISNITFTKPLLLSDGENLMCVYNSNKRNIKFFNKGNLLCVALPTNINYNFATELTMEQILTKLSLELSLDNYHTWLNENGCQRTKFNCISKLWLTHAPNEVIGEISPPLDVDKYFSHPALLDSIFQLAGFLVSAKDSVKKERSFPVKLTVLFGKQNLL
jgi:hypothetical protein